MRACRTIVVVTALVLAAWPMKTTRADDSPSPPIIERSSVHAARSLEVGDLAGRLTIEVEDRADMAVHLKGPQPAVEAVRVDAGGGVLRLSGGADPDSGTTVIHMNNVTTVVSGGGSARVSIGGRDASVTVPPRPPLFVTVRLPRATPITVAPAIDNVVIGDTEGPLRLVVATATIRAGAVGPTDLAVDGSGDVRLRRVTGDLAVSVRGSGTVMVDDGAIAALTVAIKGTGDIAVGGRAETADLSLSGAGDIRVREVRERPRSRINGAGTIAVGNW